MNYDILDGLPYHAPAVVYVSHDRRRGGNTDPIDQSVLTLLPSAVHDGTRARNHSTGTRWGRRQGEEPVLTLLESRCLLHELFGAPK